MFYPPMLDETIRVQWNGGGFGEIIDADAVEELPAPAEEDSSDK
jgi:hypothetical protein